MLVQAAAKRKALALQTFGKWRSGARKRDNCDAVTQIGRAATTRPVVVVVISVDRFVAVLGWPQAARRPVTDRRENWLAAEAHDPLSEQGLRRDSLEGDLARRLHKATCGRRRAARPARPFEDAWTTGSNDATRARQESQIDTDEDEHATAGQ